MIGERYAANAISKERAAETDRDEKLVPEE
jgi:hypothetical protein